MRTRYIKTVLALIFGILTIYLGQILIGDPILRALQSSSYDIFVNENLWVVEALIFLLFSFSGGVVAALWVKEHILKTCIFLSVINSTSFATLLFFSTVDSGVDGKIDYALFISSAVGPILGGYLIKAKFNKYSQQEKPTLRSGSPLL